MADTCELGALWEYVRLGYLLTKSWRQHDLCNNGHWHDHGIHGGNIYTVTSQNIPQSFLICDHHN